MGMEWSDRMQSSTLVVEDRDSPVLLSDWAVDPPLLLTTATRVVVEVVVSLLLPLQR